MTLYICSLEAFSLGQVESSRIGSPQVSEVFSKLAALVSTVAAEVSGTSHTTYIAAVGNTTYREVVLYRAQVCPREREREVCRSRSSRHGSLAPTTAYRCNCAN